MVVEVAFVPRCDCGWNVALIGSGCAYLTPAVYLMIGTDSRSVL
ncbi:MAG: hypothetical protein ACI8UD_004188 [Planctomycetota bacterium]|jgi:hypothetical protein